MHHITMFTLCLFTLRFLCLINTLYSRLYQLVKKFINGKKHAVTKSPTTDLRKSSALPTVHWIAVVNGGLDRHGCLSGTPPGLTPQ